ncbi:cation:proton antiporter domain-containing protein [Actinomadura kijaniata]|uniref:cation:proton antiporter domain-containing protein n=1 Tax=Actinomadura kijaniata TaxID=46161 RepID=UPI003F1B27AD
MITAAGHQDAQNVMLLLDVAVILLAGLLLGRCAGRLRQPAVIGEIVAGVVLGPSVLGRLPGDPSALLFPAEVRPLLSAVAQVGLVLFMFVVGWEFEKQLAGHARATAGVSVGAVAVAFAFGVAVAFVLYPDHSTVAGRHVPFTAFAMFMGAALSVTAFPVLARILADRGMTRTRVGTVALASAAVGDVAAWCLLAYVSALVSSGGDGSGLVRIGALSGAYVALTLFVVRPLLAWLLRRCARTRPATSLLVLCAGVFLSSWTTSWIGVHAFFGAFMFGLVMPREPEPLVRELRSSVGDMGLVLLPVFFIVTGLGVDIGGLTGTDCLMLVLVTACACAGKLGGAILPARLAGMSWREARDLGVLMNTRGLTELIILNAAVSLGILDGRMFTMLVIVALVTTAMAGPLLSWTGGGGPAPEPAGDRALTGPDARAGAGS